MERVVNLTVCILHLLDGTMSGCTGYGGHGWNNLAVQLAELDGLLWHEVLETVLFICTSVVLF